MPKYTAKTQIKTILIIILFLSVIPSFGQTEENSYKILGISVQGNKSADVATIIANSGIKEGDELLIPGDKTMNAIRQLWGLNIFSDIKILIDKQVGTGVFLLIKVLEYPRVEKVVYAGNDELDEKDFEDVNNLLRGQILKPQEVERLKGRIISLYNEDGFLNVNVQADNYVYFTTDTSNDGITVSWRKENDFSKEYKLLYEFGDDRTINNLIPKIQDRILLIYTIIEGGQITVRDILFTGNKAIDSDDLISEMSETKKAKWWKFWSGSKFDPKGLKTDEKEIIKFYTSQGYRDAEIFSDSLIFSNDREDVKILINIDEGPLYHIRNITWEGNTIYNDEILNSRLGFLKGDVYDFEKLERNLRGNEQQSDIYSLYLDNGYLMFNLDKTENRIPGDSIDVSIRMQEKNRFRIGSVDITGNDKTMDNVIRRELYTLPGDYFNRALLLRSIQQLANLKFFNVEKLYGPEGITTGLANDSTVDVGFSVSEKSSDFLNASLGYSGSFGLSGSVGFTLTNFSLAHPFSLGGGQILSFNWQFGVGSLYRTFTLGFTEPWLFNSPTLVGFQVFDTRQQFVYDLRQTGGSLTYGKRLTWPDDFFNFRALFKFQRNDVISGGGFFQEGKTQEYTFGATISRRNVDNPIFPSLGSTLDLDAQISGGPFLPGDVDYFKINFKTEWYRRLFNSNRVSLYTTADLGYIKEIEAGTPIQPFEFYFMGGNGLVIATTPLRGYADRSIGPKNVNGNVVGGRVMTRYTAELRVAVALEPIPFYLLAFVEAGNVFENIETTDPFNLKRSAGFGARLLINPVGLIGFDIGYGFDRKVVDGFDPKWEFHFQFGKGF
ncbi:MAG: outer membrane protein assembly factor BamA [Ignavibacteriales bacterium CG_4_9_14_3_um_filter_30_11]|nr:MAG: outer membrane protein assembly factor BamA [Ignavibacteriales bacterium CG_4_9_14_3_um_filter_30_11]